MALFAHLAQKAGLSGSSGVTQDTRLLREKEVEVNVATMCIEKSPSSGGSCMPSLVHKLSTGEDFVIGAWLMHCRGMAAGSVAGACIVGKMSLAKSFVFCPHPEGKAHGQTLHCRATLPGNMLYLHSRCLQLCELHCSSLL